VNKYLYDEVKKDLASVDDPAVLVFVPRPPGAMKEDEPDDESERAPEGSPPAPANTKTIWDETGLDMTDPDSWEWRAFLKGKLNRRKTIVEVFKDMLQQLIDLDTHFQLLKEQYDKSESEQGVLQSRFAVLEGQVKEIQEKSTEARRARDAALGMTERDQHAKLVAESDIVKIETDEAKRLDAHNKEMARLLALLEQLRLAHEDALAKMRAAHLKLMRELAEELAAELAQLHRDDDGGLDLDEIMAKAKQVLEDNNSPYAESKVQALRDKLAELLAREKELQDMIDARLQQIREAEEALAAAEARRQTAIDETPELDECEYGDEAMAEWKRDKDAYFEWLARTEGKTYESADAQTDPTLYPKLRLDTTAITGEAHDEESGDQPNQTFRVYNDGEGPLTVYELVRPHTHTHTDSNQL
jgi:DNA repair exonuclease SbcCD ATPase subunit